MECAGHGRALLIRRPLSHPWLGQGVGSANGGHGRWPNPWSRAVLSPETVDLVFAGADHGIQGDVEHDFERRSRSRTQARPEVMVVYGMNGGSLPPRHGPPAPPPGARLVGMTSVKWLDLDHRHPGALAGYQQIGLFPLQARRRRSRRSGPAHARASAHDPARRA